MNIYSKKDILEEIVFWNDDSFPNLKKIFSQQIPICVDMTEEEYDLELEDEESPISIFSSENPTLKLIPIQDYFQEIENDIDEIKHKSNSLFFLNIDESLAIELTEKYAVYVFSSSNLNDNCLFGGYSVELEKDQIIPKGWGNIFSFKRPPTNSLVISDSYLFMNEENGKNLGIENLIAILDAILPQKLEVLFNITIISDNDPKNSNKPAKSINWWIQEFGKLKTRISSLRKGYEIEVELYLSHTVHKRVLLTNFSYGWSDQGFDLFKNSNSNKVHQSNDFHFHTVFNNLNDFGDSFLSMRQKKLNEIKVICDKASEVVNKNGQSISIMVFGDVNTNKKSKNPLLN